MNFYFAQQTGKLKTKQTNAINKQQKHFRFRLCSIMMVAVPSPQQNVKSYFREEEEEMLQQFYDFQILTIMLYGLAPSLWNFTASKHIILPDIFINKLRITFCLIIANSNVKSPYKLSKQLTVELNAYLS